MYDFEIHRLRYLKLNELGLYNYFGEDESSLTWENCGQVSEIDCAYFLYGGYGYSVGSNLYFTQIALAGQFQEPISLEKWAAGDLHCNTKGNKLMQDMR